jgi:hypothetical protein
MTHPLRRMAWLLHAALFTALLWTLWRFLAHGVACIGYRYSLDFGEGIVWQQALLIPGPRMYGDITRPPFIVFHYPPLYHLTARAVATLGIDGLAAGRLVSLTATLVIAGCLAWLAWLASVARCGRKAAAWGAAIAFILPFGMQPIFFWAPLMRVDMLAAALGFAGLVCAALAPARPGLLPAAGLIFVAALYTKQTAVAAPAAALAVLALAMPGPSFRAVLLAGAAGLTAMLGLSLATDGRFLHHIVGYNVNRFDLLAGLRLIAAVTLAHLGYLLAAVAEVGFLLRELVQARGGRGLSPLLREDQGARVAAMLLAYAAITTLMLPMVGKSGAAINYFIEWCCALAVLVGMLSARGIAELMALPPSARPHLGPLVLPALLAVLLVQVQPPWHPYLGLEPRLRGLQALETELHDSGRPAISDEMVLLIRAGPGVTWESAIFAELATQGRWDQAPLLAMLAARDFAFVATEGVAGQPVHNSRYTQAVSAAIDAAYPLQSVIAGGLVVRRPP